VYIFIIIVILIITVISIIGLIYEKRIPLKVKILLLLISVIPGILYISILNYYEREGLDSFQVKYLIGGFISIYSIPFVLAFHL
jgi:hypothetical protein